MTHLPGEISVLNSTIKQFWIKLFWPGFAMLFSGSAFGQNQRNDFVLSPQLFVNETEFKSNVNTSFQRIFGGSSVQYYIADQLGIGFFVSAFYANNDPKIPSAFRHRRTAVAIQPEIQYNILKTRLTPFLKVQALEIRYDWQFSNNPLLPEKQRKNRQFSSDTRVNTIGGSIGLSYSFKRKHSAFVSANASPIKHFKLSNTMIAVGGQFVLNRRK